MANAEGSATIDDFNTIEDSLLVVYQGDEPTLGQSSDGAATTVFADGLPVARILGVSSINLDDVQLVEI
jgi:hypothetical protein